MNIVFASGNGYPPEFLGGVQSSTDQLVRQCRAAGHEAAVLCELFGGGLFGLRARVELKLTRRGVATDRKFGYPVMRAWKPADVTDYVMSEVRPDVVVVQCHGAVRIGQAFAKHGVPLILYLRNMEYDELDGDPRDLPNVRYIANSEFTAKAYKKEFGIESEVIPPLIARECYWTKSTKEFVTFIGIDPQKGLEKAFEIAGSCPDIPFLFVESWVLNADALAEIKARTAVTPNISFHGRVDDMRQIYGRTRILLAPSKWEEAWGRVASEAHLCGIPVIGSSRGGLPEAIGPGGAVLDYDAPLETWTDALNELWTDSELYQKASEAARVYSERPDMQAPHQFALFQAVLSEAYGTASVTPALAK